jgi:hypothetical protein
MTSRPTIHPIARRLSRPLLTGLLILTLSPFASLASLPLLPAAPALAADSGPQSIMLELNPNENLNRRKPPLVYQLKPTRSVEDVLTIRNFSPDQDYDLRVYAVDSLQGGDGTIAFQLATRPRNNIGQWVRFDQEIITVEAGATTFVPYRITIPENSAPGTFQGGLVAEIATPASDSQVKIVPRLIEPIIISIPGRKNLRYSLDDFSMHERDGEPCFHFFFSNNSNVMLFGQATLSIDGTMLPEPYQLAANDLTILQGETLEKGMHFSNPPLWGNYRATLSLEIYEFNAATGQMVLLDTLTRQLDFTIIPWCCIIAFFVLVGLLAGAEYCRRHYLRARLAETFVHLVKKGETIVSIAETYRVNWKTVAKLNKLRKPYTISPGDTLNLPFPKVNPAATTSPAKPSRSLDKKGK